VINLPNPFRRPLSRRLVRAAGGSPAIERMSVRELIDTLGDRSFGWCVIVFALLNLIPLPIGANMVTSLPLILVTAQMALGMERVRLPDAVMRRTFNRRAFQKLVLRLGPLMRPIERMTGLRLPMMFSPVQERVLGAFLLVVSLALFLPVPVATWLLAISLLVSGIGLVERDGLITVGGVLLGCLSIAVTVTIGIVVLHGADAVTR
jgi:hypothetical protein